VVLLSAARALASAPASSTDPLLAAIERSASSRADAGDLKLGEARTLLDAGQVDLALAAIQEAIQLSPRQAEYFVLLERVPLVRGLIPESQLAYGEAARLDPANAEAVSRR
jgi:cytochrome c-type biogenesis protein CcmH/NrfG